jgi:predicted small integral membrane protein
MIAVRLVKTAMVASIALLALLVAIDNVIDYPANYEFVRHTLSMDTIFLDSVLRSRAITSPALWAAAYWLIIAVEALTGCVLAFATIRLLAALGASDALFNAAKRYVTIGVGLGFLLYFTGFMVVGGEWFSMWQSKAWNGQQSAFWFYATMLLVALFVNQPDGDVEPGRSA